MTDCCGKDQIVHIEHQESCPSCERKGKKVKLITVKSMLIPSGLETLNANSNHYFCSTETCNVVYFDTDNKTYLISEIKEIVHQKDNSSSALICYCFGWTREKIKDYLNQEEKVNPIEHIRENIKEKRCGCEVNNPQGSCCLGDVTSHIKSIS